MRSLVARIALLSAFALVAQAAFAQCPASVPVEGASPPGPLPIFPADNWWNTDISSAPVDANSASFIAFVNGSGTRRLHPDFGGEESPGSVAIYGMPFAIVDSSQPKQAVTFKYWDQSDGVNYSTHQGVPFYPIPAQAITQPHWVEGGAPGNVDQRSSSDRHLLMIDCTNRTLYELYNVYYDAAQARWLAGSGAFFDLKTNARRPDTWTSADAAGLAIFPGLVRYDDAWNAAITDIGHAFRVTVRTTNGYVYPASHNAGSTSGALPMGARLRLKPLVGGLDPALRTSDPNVRKIFRAMQKYGLIVADNGSDLYVTGTFDTRWNNDILNPAFALLTASDFDVVQLGWQPPPLAQRTYVSAQGSDAAACSPSSPCRSFGTAITRTLAGGEVVALDSSDYPPFTITKAISIVGAPGGYAGVSAAAGQSAIAVNTGPTDVVYVRGLALSAAAGSNGILFTGGGALYLDSVSVRGGAIAGVNFLPATDATLSIKDSDIKSGAIGVNVANVAGAVTVGIDGTRFESNANGVVVVANGQVTLRNVLVAGGSASGISLASAHGAPLTATLDRMLVEQHGGNGFAVGGTLPVIATVRQSTFRANAGYGVYASGGASASVIRLDRNTIAANGIGVGSGAGGSILSRGNNTIEGNATDGAPSGAYVAK